MRTNLKSIIALCNIVLSVTAAPVVDDAMLVQIGLGTFDDSYHYPEAGGDRSTAAAPTTTTEETSTTTEAGGDRSTAAAPTTTTEETSTTTEAGGDRTPTTATTANQARLTTPRKVKLSRKKQNITKEENITLRNNKGKKTKNTKKRDITKPIMRESTVGTGEEGNNSTWIDDIHDIMNNDPWRLVAYGMLLLAAILYIITMSAACALLCVRLNHTCKSEVAGRSYQHQISTQENVSASSL
jgi:hypothetical protein